MQGAEPRENFGDHFFAREKARYPPAAVSLVVHPGRLLGKKTEPTSLLVTAQLEYKPNERQEQDHEPERYP